VEGTIERREKFGLFIALEPGVTGLMPRSAMTGGEPALERLREGARLTVRVQAIDLAARKITLVPATEGEEGWQPFAAPAEPRSLGSLGEKLQEAMKRAGKKSP
jgi:small subunit ribosomal protein S1